MLSAIQFSMDQALVTTRRWLEDRLVAPFDSRVSFDEAYTYAYTGTCAGTTSLASATYTILLWVMTDTLYYINSSAISSNRWSVGSATAGIKIVEAVATSGTDTSPSGTVDYSGTGILGTGTAFLTEAVVGGSILVDGQRRYIKTISADDVIVVSAAFDGSASGQTYKLFGASTAKTVSTGTQPSLPLSFSVPDTDPDSVQTTLPYRCYLYDAALLLLTFAMEEDETRGDALVTAISTTMTNTDTALSTTGALAFSNNAYNLGEGDFTVVRVGAMAWVGYALLIYYERTGNSTALTLATSMHTYFDSLKVATGTPDDYRAGLVRGGQDSAVELQWVSTEHNTDLYYFYKKFYALTGTATYQTMMDDISDGMLANLYIAALDRFVQGTTATDKDYAEPLDAYSWAGNVLLDIGENDKATDVANRMSTKFWTEDKTIPLENSLPGQFNQTFYSTINFNGYRTYTTTTDGETADSYVDPPDSVWQEGAQGVLLFLERMKRNGLSDDVTDFDEYYLSARASQYALWTITNDGSLLAWTESDRATPYEFQVWKALAPAAWLYLREKYPDIIFFR